MEDILELYILIEKRNQLKNENKPTDKITFEIDLLECMILI